MITIYARDNDQPGNRDLVQFLETNLDVLVARGCRFTFQVLDSESDVKLLVDKGATKLPVMSVNNRLYCGSTSIKQYLATGFKAPGGSTSPEESFRAWQLKEMSEAAKKIDDMDEVETGEGLKQKAEAAIKARQEAQQQSASKAAKEAKETKEAKGATGNAKKESAQSNTRSSSDIIKAAQSGSHDDKLLARMFEATDDG